MKFRIIIFLLISFISLNAIAQKDVVLKRLQELNINTEFLDKSDDQKLYSFHAVNTTHSASFDTTNKKVNVLVYDFNPKNNPKNNNTFFIHFPLLK